MSDVSTCAGFRSLVRRFATLEVAAGAFVHGSSGLPILSGFGCRVQGIGFELRVWRG